MKTVDITGINFSGKKFAARYGLAWNDFYSVMSGVRSILYFPDALPDSPVLEECNASKVVTSSEWVKLTDANKIEELRKMILNQ